MRYRILGRTGFKVSEFGLGGHEYARFPSPYHFQSSREPGEELNREELLKNQEERNKLIRKAIDSGINYFDTTLVEEAQSLGLALQELGKRDEVIIAAETIHPLKNLDNTPRNRWEDLVSGGVEARLRQLKTDQIDVYNLHMPEVGYSPEKFSVAIQTLETLRDEGKIVSIGASSHDPRFLAELIRIYDSFDAVTVRYNYHLQKAREFLFPLCKALDIGVTVMKPLCWPYYGIPFTNFCPENLKQGEYTPAQTSFRWILGSPEVSTIITGIYSTKELEELIATFNRGEEINEAVLQRSLEKALSPEGLEKLRELSRCEETRIDIKGYAKKASKEK